MKETKRVGVNGKTVTILEPESVADAAKLRQMVKEGKVDGRISFGDMREKK
jgi:hypothetical protein